VKGKVSILLYAAAVPLAFVRPSTACALYIGVAIIWLIPIAASNAGLRKLP
jgi:hypothetical protein